MGVTIDDARAIAATLPRSYEALVRDRVKFRVGQIVYAAFSRDETIMGFGFPREERDALVASEPDKFLMPSPSDMRFRWVQVRLDAIDVDERRELLVDAWRLCVPKKVRDAYNHANASGGRCICCPTTDDKRLRGDTSHGRLWSAGRQTQHEILVGRHMSNGSWPRRTVRCPRMRGHIDVGHDPEVPLEGTLQHAGSVE
jgi:hypothetical protein